MASLRLRREAIQAVVGFIPRIKKYALPQRLVNGRRLKYLANSPIEENDDTISCRC